jgi:hypothetical protein
MTDHASSASFGPDLAAAELAVIERLLGPARWYRLASPGSLICLGDWVETAYAIFENGGLVRIKEEQRGVVNETLTASSTAIALRFLTYVLAGLARPTWWPMIKPAEYAPGVRLVDDANGQRLCWREGWLLFPRLRSSAEWEVRTFSWVARATPDEVAASYLEPSGAPLFHIDLATKAPHFPRVLPPDASPSG